MSINLTQAFVFETDDLKSLQAILSVVVRTLMPTPRLALTEPDHFWADDGRYNQEFIDSCYGYVNGDSATLLEPSETFGGATFLSARNIGTKDDIAAEISARYKKDNPLIPKYSWIASLYPSHYRPSFGRQKGFQAFPGYDKLITQVMEMAKAKDKAAFRFEYSAAEWDNFDGSIGEGYRLYQSYDAGWSVLHLAMCHIYYGK